MDGSDINSTVLALVDGQPLTQLPEDLYIPPDALKVLLDSFSGPLDLLLYLIRRQNIDILNIPMLKITQQYLQYIHLMKQRRLELAADYLVMAALLTEIKSRMLLPQRISETEDIEEDPRMVLVRCLQEYERFKEAAVQLDALPRYERDIFPVHIATDALEVPEILPEVELKALLQVMYEVLNRQTTKTHHQIQREPLSVREKMSFVLERLQVLTITEFTSLLLVDEGRRGVVVTFLAILELSKQSLVSIIQAALFSPIHIQAAHHG